MADERRRRPTPRGRGKVGGSRKTSSAPRPATRGAARPSPVERLRAAGARRSRPASAPQQRRVRHQRAGLLRVIAIVAAALVALALLAAVALFVLRNSPAFSITSVEVEPSEHVSVDDVGSLVQVPEGATLLNFDGDAIEASMRKNPWVASVSFTREFPGTLKISIQERTPAALVLMASQTVAWYLSADNTWIEPVVVSAAEGQSTTAAALALAEQQGCLLIAGVPSTVDPVAGSTATDEVLDAVRAFQDGFSDEFAAQVACYNAPSVDNVSCVLESGVEVSLGSPTEISEKQRVVEGFLAQNEGAVVRINVRVPSSPAYREISSDNIQAGAGVGDAGQAEQTQEQQTEASSAAQGESAE